MASVKERPIFCVDWWCQRRGVVMVCRGRMVSERLDRGWSLKHYVRLSGRSVPMVDNLLLCVRVWWYCKGLFRCVNEKIESVKSDWG